MKYLLIAEGNIMFCNKRGNGFWSIDAAVALLIAVVMFAMFSAVLQAASFSALHGAKEASGELLSARFSSYALQRLENGKLPDLPSVLERTGREFASMEVSSSEGVASFASAGEKREGIAAYCTQRLFFMSGKITRVEACIQ
jgi:hypothetical protein